MVFLYVIVFSIVTAGHQKQVKKAKLKPCYSKRLLLSSISTLLSLVIIASLHMIHRFTAHTFTFFNPLNLFECLAQGCHGNGLASSIVIGRLEHLSQIHNLDCWFLLLTQYTVSFWCILIVMEVTQGGDFVLYYNCLASWIVLSLYYNYYGLFLHLQLLLPESWASRVAPNPTDTAMISGGSVPLPRVTVMLHCPPPAEHPPLCQPNVAGHPSHLHPPLNWRVPPSLSPRYFLIKWA